jgi:hypothetical protein
MYSLPRPAQLSSAISTSQLLSRTLLDSPPDLNGVPDVRQGGNESSGSTECPDVEFQNAVPAGLHFLSLDSVSPVYPTLWTLLSA